MIIRNQHKTMISKEISDSLIHTAPLPYRWFIITSEMTVRSHSTKQNEQAQVRAL